MVGRFPDFEIQESQQLKDNLENQNTKASDTQLNICWSTKFIINVAAVVQQMLNTVVSCHVECWNMPFNTLN